MRGGFSFSFLALTPPLVDSVARLGELKRAAAVSPAGVTVEQQLDAIERVFKEHITTRNA